MAGDTLHSRDGDGLGTALAAALLDHPEAAFVLLDDRLRFSRVSRGYTTLIGLPAQTLIGRRPSQVLPAPHGRRAEQAARRAIEGCAPASEVALLPGPDGHRRLRFTWRPVPGADGRPGAVLCVVVDVTEEHRARQLLREGQWRTARLQAMTDQLAGALAADDVARTVDALGRSIGAERTELHLLDARLQRFPWPDLPADEPGQTPRMVPDEWSEALAATVRDGRARYFPAGLPEPEAGPAEAGGGGRARLGPPRTAPDRGAHPAGPPTAAPDQPSGIPGQSRDPAAAPREVKAARAGVRSWAVLPLVASGAPLGGLRLVFEGEHRFDADDRAFLDALAGQCALAVERSWLYERERQAALSLQRSLLPRRLPAVRGVEAGYRYLPGAPGTEVGGDWYDCFQLPDDRVAMVVGDVIGKGLTAAAGMGRVRSALRALAFTDPEPAAVLAGLDRLFTATEDDESLTTVLYGVLDPATGELAIGDAGHLPALVVSVDGRARLVDAGPAATPLGIAEPRVQRVVRLDPGDIVVGFSDGLVETRTRGLQQGLDLLLELAGGRPAGDGGLQALLGTLVSGMLAGQERNDDVTVLGVRIAAAEAGPRGPSSASVTRATKGMRNT
ncbi:SpoIIE family protein phosphatase [Streptacidiphilus griseoplanus]|uniref:SpoIIE family protein phosphatase n=1 Tax=Peterkaempfera griseoplana TaxID=66896 RepID=UPI0006E3860B|nr:SpoIIE family protein phosphatase [Peterkaempfera griseoplana]